MKLFVDNLTNIDFSYLHPERGLLGESLLVQLELDGELNEQGMICDFAVVKRRVKQWMDTFVDHVLLVPEQMNDLRVTEQQGQITVEWNYPDGGSFFCQSPKEAIILVDVAAIDCESLARWCETRLQQSFPEVKGLRIGLVQEAIEGVSYHYSHGLQKHDGNCQRIAHGHRSRLEIFVDGQKDLSLEQQWGERFCDIYIGSRDHLIGESNGCHQYQYQAAQGEFLLTLPASRCYLIETDTTVELIAEHLWQQIKQQLPERHLRVKAYEGIGKGAIVEG